MVVYVERKEVEKVGWVIIVESFEYKIMKMIRCVMLVNERIKLRFENKIFWKWLLFFGF